MSENIIVLFIVSGAIAFVVMKISRSLSGNGMTCGCGSERGCAGCGDFNHGHPEREKKQNDTGSGS